MTPRIPRPDLVSSARETSEDLGVKDRIVPLARAKVLLMEMADEVDRLRAAAAEDRARIAGLVAAIRGYRDCHDRLKWDGRCSCDECRAAAVVLAKEDKSC